MREIRTHQINPFNKNNVEVSALDEAGPGGASHHYRVDAYNWTGPDSSEGKSVAEIQFQKGPVKEAGVNGVSDEALFAILIDRLQGFQKGPYSCRENACALTKLEESLMWLHKRTLNREQRGVEGTSMV